MNLEDFETRVLPSKNKLYRFAFRLLGSSEEAKDVVQETMIKSVERSRSGRSTKHGGLVHAHH